MFRSYAAELIALVGRDAYDKLAELCDARLAAGIVAEHPATTKARALATPRKPGGREPATPPHPPRP
jgi:hypothetical protein